MTSLPVYRGLKEELLAKLSPAHRAEVEQHIAYTLNVLGQETMSREAIALIISYTKDKYESQRSADS